MTPETLLGYVGVQRLTRELGGVREECLLVPRYVLYSTSNGDRESRRPGF
jgi:hypothetical protein